MSSCSSTICWRDCLESTALSLLLCQRSVDSIHGNLFLGFLFRSIYLSCSFANTALSWLLELYTKSWSWEGISILILFFCFNIVLTILGLLPLHINFWIIWKYSQTTFFLISKPYKMYVSINTFFRVFFFLMFIQKYVLAESWVTFLTQLVEQQNHKQCLNHQVSTKEICY